jgi:hypothetical protein
MNIPNGNATILSLLFGEINLEADLKFNIGYLTMRFKRTQSKPRPNLYL